MITKISSSITSIAIKILFVFLIVSIIIIFAFLIGAKQGISIDELDIFDHKISKLYIKWNKKLHINIQSIENHAQESSSFGLPPLYLILNLLDHTTQEISITHYIKGTENLSFNYTNDKISLLSADLMVSADIKHFDSYILISPLKVELRAFGLELDGELKIHDRHQRMELTSHALLDKRLEGNFALHTKKDLIRLSASSASVPNLEFLNRFITIPEKIKPWIFQKLKAGSYKLDTFSSSFSLSDPSKFLPNLIAKATLNDVSYSFDPALYPIVAKQASIEYKRSSLLIKPSQATYNDYNISKVRLTLSDLKNKPKLLLYFKTKEHVNDSFLKIIEHYLHKIPLKQLSGSNEIDFQLILDLLSSQVNIATDIRVKDADLRINEHPIHIYDAKVNLINSDLSVLYAKFKSLKTLKTSFSGKINLATRLGALKVHISHFYTPMVRLLKDITMDIDFQKSGIVVNTSDSHWKLFKHLDFRASKSTLFIDKQQRVSLTPIHFSKLGLIDAHLAGAFSLSDSNQSDTLKFDFKTFKVNLDHNRVLALEHPFVIEASSSKKGHFESNRSIHLSLDEKPVSLNNFSLDVGEILHLKLDDFRFKESFQASVDLLYNQKKKRGYCDISDLNALVALSKPDLLAIKDQQLHFEIDAKERLKIDEKNLKISYKKPSNHELTFDDLSRITPFSPLLEKHQVKEGRVSIISSNFEYFNLFASLNYFPIDGYINSNKDETIFIKSTYGKEGLKTIINDAITVSVDDMIHLDIENTNLDLQPFLKADEKQASAKGSKKEQLPPIEINAKEGFLQLSQSDKILYTKLNATIEYNTIKASLLHDKGEALLSLRDKHIELYGQNFNELFIQNLINFKGLKGGKYNFFIEGNSDKLLGGIEISDATFKGFALYNNILGFFNTVPALLTFNAPGFNLDGFKTKKGEIHFEKLKDTVNLKAIKLKGETSTILGSGSIDLKRGEIDLSLRLFLLKDMGKILSSVPIAGYLLLGEDGSLTTTISIKGKLNDPKISVDLGQDILMAPINILKRTLLAPVRLFDWLTGKKEKAAEF